MAEGVRNHAHQTSPDSAVRWRSRSRLLENFRRRMLIMGVITSEYRVNNREKTVGRTMLGPSKNTNGDTARVEIFQDGAG